MKLCTSAVNVVLMIMGVVTSLHAESWDPAAADYTGNQGSKIYVSKLGDNSDGRSWQHALHSIQAAFDRIPDDKGGHQIIIRPDTYVEANLYPAFKGAPGAYNLLIGDVDGSLGSNTTGRIIIDSGDPKKGFKSWDWWSSFRMTDKNWPRGNNKETFSGIICDRWIFRKLYATGSDGGLFWDLTDKSGEGFTVIVEDCVGIGRAFGGGVCYPVVRPDEPSIFRRSYFLSLDWIEDTAAVLVGGWENSIPEYPHLILENCTMVHPDNALAMSYASHCVRVKLTDCRLIALNFTQPGMSKEPRTATGIICTERYPHHGTEPRSPGQKLHVDLEDCMLAGYSVFTPGEDSDCVSYTTKGNVRAYVQFQQTVPAGFERVGLWPVELFDHIAPPKVENNRTLSKRK